MLGGNRGHKIGDDARSAGVAAVKALAAERKAGVLPTIREIQAAGTRTLAGIATALNERGITTPRGSSWAPAQVSKVLATVAK